MLFHQSWPQLKKRWWFGWCMWESCSIVLVTWVYEVIEPTADHPRYSLQEKPVDLNFQMTCDKGSRNAFQINMLANSAIEWPPLIIGREPSVEIQFCRVCLSIKLGRRHESFCLAGRLLLLWFGHVVFSIPVHVKSNRQASVFLNGSLSWCRWRSRDQMGYPAQVSDVIGANFSCYGILCNPVHFLFWQKKKFRVDVDLIDDFFHGAIFIFNAQKKTDAQRSSLSGGLVQTGETLSSLVLW